MWSHRLKKILRGMVYVLPLVLYFSYYPLIKLGANESMNFELSLPLIWLVVFDGLAVLTMWQQKLLFVNFGKKWRWLILPIFLTMTVFWSLNFVRGVLTVGIVWLIYIAIDVIYSLREFLFDAKFWRNFWRVFFGSAILVCVWCVLQCVLDINGVGREYTLMCAGCTYQMFGFPHPNGFAIEPQFMGNLLLAPAIVAGWMFLTKQSNKNAERECSRGDNFYNKSVGAHTKFQFRDSLRDCCKNHSGSHSLCSAFLLLCFVLITSTLFLTFSRGAIYAFIVALVFMTVLALVKVKRNGRMPLLKRFLAVWGIVVFSFVFTLNMQGLMAEISPTNDTYDSGVAKVINHLSLGVIEIRGGDAQSEETHAPTKKDSKDKEEAAFDGYVAESTNTRVRLTNAALTIWAKEPSTTIFGVGLGGAGQALYQNDLSPAPKEIVQNEYASLLLETGIVGIALFITTIIMVVKVVTKNKAAVMILTLMVAYGVTLFFFSGLPNALHIYLLLAVFVCAGDYRGSLKKLVS